MPQKHKRLNPKTIAFLLMVGGFISYGSAQVIMTKGGTEVPAGNVGPSSASTMLDSLSDARLFIFVPEQKSLLPGQSQEKLSNGSPGALKDADRIGALGLVSLFYQNASYIDGRYNNGDYPVEKGYVTDSSGAERFPAYRIHPPQRKATEFLASRHAISYRFETAENQVVYRLSEGRVSAVARISASRIAVGSDTLLRELQASELGVPEVYVFAAERGNLSAYAGIDPGVEGARIFDSGALSVFQVNYAVKATLFDTASDFDYGPDTHENSYSYRRQYHGVLDAAGFPGVVWQDKSTLGIYVTWMGPQLSSPNTLALRNDRKELLASACSSPDGTLFYLTVQQGSGIKDGKSRTMGAYKCGADGKPLAAKALDASATGLNAVDFEDDVASMAWSSGKLGIILSRRMHRGADGLNHQGGISLVLDAGNLGLLKYHGQTSGHSFDSMVVAGPDATFAGIDLGDNYPRGVNLHRFDSEGRASAVVYTFKTQHGATPASPAGRSYPPYAAISGGSKKFYSWSNDNRTYTELGGVVPGPEGFTVAFAGENTADGRALDNSRTGAALNDSRNVGLVLASGDFWNVPKGGAQLIPPGLVLTEGKAESGGFFTFGGTWSAQNNYGVVWLTDYRSKDRENASRLKAVGLPDGSVLLLWEKWTPTAYVSTCLLRVDQYGKKLSPIVDIGTGVRLGRREDPLAVGDLVYLFSGDRVNSSLRLHVIRFK